MPQTLNSILMLFVFKHTGSLSKLKQPGPLLTLGGAIRWGSGKKEVKKERVSLLFSSVPEERIGIWNRLMKDLGHGTGFQWEQRGRVHPAHPGLAHCSVGSRYFHCFLVRLEIHSCM